MTPKRRAASEPYTYLHTGTLVVGDLSVEGRLRIDGTVRGSVRASGVLEVAPGGRVEGGPVHAAEVRVAGTVQGDVHADGRAEVWRGGAVEGDIHAAALDIEEGARFRGRSVMPGDAAEAPTSADPPAAPPRPGREPVLARAGARVAGPGSVGTPAGGGDVAG